MTKPLTLPPLDEEALTELRRRYEKSPDAETSTRYQMLLLSLRGQKSSQIATPCCVVRIPWSECSNGSWQED